MHNNHLFSRTSSSIARFSLCAAMLGGLYVGSTASAQSIDPDATVTYSYDSFIKLEFSHTIAYEGTTIELDSETKDIDITLNWVEGNTYRGTGTYTSAERMAYLVYDDTGELYDDDSYDSTYNANYTIEVTATRSYNGADKSWSYTSKIWNKYGNLIQNTTGTIEDKGVTDDISTSSGEYISYANPLGYECFTYDDFPAYRVETLTENSGSISRQMEDLTEFADTDFYGEYYHGHIVILEDTSEIFTFNPSE